jgi:hypothetical protein
MCDYSLHNVASRPAKVGDKLVTTRFIHSITRGFAAAEDPTTAVCLIPGTEIAFDGDVEWDHPFKLFRKQKLDQRVARFRQVNMDNPNTHHDALEFPGGQIVLVTQLYEGQRVTVLQLPATPRPVQGAEEHPEETAQPQEQRRMQTVI